MDTTQPSRHTRVTAQPAGTPHSESTPPGPDQRFTPPRRPRLTWLRALPLLGRPIAWTMPWPTLLTGCVAGTLFLAISAHVADTSNRPLDQGDVRVAFLAAIAALAFAPRTQFRPLSLATPVPAWVAPACHLLLAVPVLALTCLVQLRIMSHTIPLHTRGPGPALYPLLAELTAWCAGTAAAAAWVDRSRYADLGGAIVVPVTFAAIALASYLPVAARFLAQPPATSHEVTITWYVIALVALALTCLAMRDRWHRYARDVRRRSPAGRSRS
jgi:hypothetical protein